MNATISPSTIGSATDSAPAGATCPPIPDPATLRTLDIRRASGLLENPQETLAREEVTVADVMVRNVVMISPQTSVREAAKMLMELQIRHLLVKDAERNLIGVLSDRDVLYHFARPGNAASEAGEISVEAVMSRHIVTVGPETPIQVAAETMVARKISCLPILAHGKLVGIVTSTDLLLALRILESTLKQAALDNLTGLYNRRVFLSRLQEELARCVRRPEPLSLMLLDMDRFKILNDRYGHGTGDQALMLMAQCLKKSLRTCDTVARYGGDEFAVLLPQTDFNQGKTVADRVCSELSQIVIHVPTGAIAISGSIGVVTLEQHGREWTPERLFTLADQALYEAKARGRNCAYCLRAASVAGDVVEAPTPSDADVTPVMA
jgi:diguanylate cyclase (GGDEF)-like protein